MHRVVEFFQKIDLRQFLIWCECLLCALLILYIFHKIFRSKKIVVNNGKNGTISISGNALNDAILTIAKQSGLHGKIKLKIKCRRKKLIVNMRVHASAQHNISNISGIIHHRLNEILLKSVGLDVENEVNVTIAGFSFEKSAEVFSSFPAENQNQAPLCHVDKASGDSCSSFTTNSKSETGDQKTTANLEENCYCSQDAEQVQKFDEKYICMNDKN